MKQLLPAVKMNPNAMQFSPINGAVVKHTAASDHTDDNTRDLIMHESIKQMLHEMSELGDRVVNVEQENATLKLEVKFLKQSQANGVNGLAVKSNLTGYAASEASSSGRFFESHIIGLSNANT